MTRLFYIGLAMTIFTSLLLVVMVTLAFLVPELWQSALLGGWAGLLAARTYGHFKDLWRIYSFHKAGDGK